MSRCTDLYVLPLFIPIPSFDRHVIASCENDARSWMHGQASDVVRMGLKCSDLLMGVVVEDTQLEIVGACDKPVFAADKLDAANRDFCNLKSFDHCSCVVVIYVDSAVVETSQKPRFGWMKIDAFDTV
jgi:hypothetical protein